MADFVKGDPYQDYSTFVADGIMMHRRIDKLTDSLPAVKRAKMLFSQEHRRIAPITLDIVWDHFLALHWAEIESQMPLQAFSLWAEGQIAPMLQETPMEFQRLNKYLWRDRWLENYASLTFIGKVLKGMADRRPKLGRLSSSIEDVIEHYADLETIFWQFYPDMLTQAKYKRL